MHNLRLYFWFLIVAVAAIGAALGFNPAAIAQDEPQSQKGVEVLTRGPVHEAFAQVVSFTPQPGAIAPKAPPDPIEEIPPDQKPDGPNVAWIPGYWTWDDDRTDFLWVSGVWRSLPPGRQWVPGYWTGTDQGFQWISGYWADAQASSVEYLPEPPQSLEEGPNVDPPSSESVWIPGTWIYYHGRYAWRPGHWVIGRADWMWVPAYYVWSPRGCVFIEGYWDYSIARRGLLFAPVYFNSAVYAQSGFSYVPAIVINVAVFNNFLFLRPTFGHYYFGDYFGTSYASAGFYPWFAFHSQFRGGYDPIFAAQNWQHRNDPDWERNLHSQFDERRENEASRPAHTLADQTKRGGGKGEEAGLIAAPLAKMAVTKESELRLTPVSKQERNQMAQAAEKVRSFGNEREKLETRDATAEKPRGRDAEPDRIKLPSSPIAAKSAEGTGKEHTPPEIPKHPKPDTTIEPGTTRGREAGEPTKTEPGVKKGLLGRERPGTEPGTKKGEVEPNLKKFEPRPDLPKAEPKSPKAEPSLPKAEPKPKKVEPAPDLPKAEPKPKKVEPRPEPPKVVPPKGPPPKVEPKGKPAPPPKGEPKEKPKAG